MSVGAEHELPKGVNKNIKRHNWFYISGITANKYDNSCKEWDQELDKLETEIIEHSRAHKEFTIALSTLLNIASRANELFEISKPEQKRRLVNFIFSNLKLEGQKLVFNLKMPFDQMALLSKSENWLWRSPLRPKGYLGQADFPTKHLLKKGLSPLLSVRASSG